MFDACVEMVMVALATLFARSALHVVFGCHDAGDFCPFMDSALFDQHF
jgi:hypothetical protein